MSLLSLKWIPRYLRWKDPFRKGAQEASDQYLGKAGKLQTFNEMTLSTDMRDLAEDDRQGVAALKAKHGFGEKKRGGFMGLFGGSENRDAIVCDDMQIKSGSNFAELLLAVLIGAVAVWWFTSRDTSAAESPKNVEVNVPDSSYDVLFYDKEGNQITVPRLPVGAQK